jgi:hypothetical protein
MLISISAPIAQVAQAQEYTLTILNPKAYVEKIPITPLAERLDTFEGKKIAIYSIGLAGNTGAMTSIMTERWGPSVTGHAGVSYALVATKGGVGLTDNWTAYESSARAADAVIVSTAF